MQKLVRIATQPGSLSPVCEAPISVAARAGPSTFVSALNTEKPGEDRKAFDARQLVLHQAAQDVVQLCFMRLSTEDLLTAVSHLLPMVLVSKSDVVRTG